MIDNYDKIKGYVLLLSGQEDNPKLDFQINIIIDECLAYCYRKDVPEQMERPLADVIVNELNRKGIFTIDGDITSYKEGDMQVSFGGISTNSTGLKYNGKLDSFKLIIGVVDNV